MVNMFAVIVDIVALSIHIAMILRHAVRNSQMQKKNGYFICMTQSVNKTFTSHSTDLSNITTPYLNESLVLCRTTVIDKDWCSAFLMV